MKQQSLFGEYETSLGGCGNCICASCLYAQTSRCPFGSCYDDWRAVNRPYPFRERRSWSNWALPGEQEHWCRGGMFYKASSCEHYVRYDDAKTRIENCLEAPNVVYQDGYRFCSLVDCMGCEECYRRFEEKSEQNDTQL